MTDNPYAAPQVASHTVDVFEHIKAIRKVAKIFRVLGWIGFAIFAPLSAISIPAAAWYFFNPQEAPRAFTLEHDYARAVEEMHRGMAVVLSASSGRCRRRRVDMTDNPYAAPQAVSYVREESVHTKSIRTVATIYRILGGFLIANFGLGSLFALNEMSNLLIQDPLPGVAPAPILFPLLGSAGCFVLFIGLAALGWEYVLIGIGMLNRHPLDYGRVRFFAYLMLLGFPLILLGAYCIVQLRRHWQAYCEESLLFPGELMKSTGDSPA